MPDRPPRPHPDPRDTATWGLIDAWDDEADTDADKLTALAPWIQQLTEIMTAACGHPIDPNDPHMIHAAPCEARNWPESCNADACSCSRICVACCAVCGPRSIVARYLLAAPEQGDWPWEDHCDGMAGGIVEALRAAGALVGGRPAAPTRTPDGILRQQVTDAVWRNLGARTSKRAVEATIDELVALLSRSAAEPPEIDREQLLAQIEERRGDEAFMRRLRARIYRDRPLLDRLDGVAAEPNEEHDDAG